MNIDKYLKQIQEDYSNPIQTRPKPTAGITGEKPDTPETEKVESEEGTSASIRGPSGINVNLDINDSDRNYRINKQIGRTIK